MAVFLCGKILLERTRAQPCHQAGSRGRRPWVYRPAQTFSQYAGDLIGALLDHSPHPAAVLAHALATTPGRPVSGMAHQALYVQLHTVVDRT